MRYTNNEERALRNADNLFLEKMAAPQQSVDPNPTHVDDADAGLGGLQWLAQQVLRPGGQQQMQNIQDAQYRQEADRRAGQALLAKIFPAVNETVPGLAEQRHQTLVSQISQISAIRPAPDNYYPYFDSNSLYSRSGDVHIGPSLDGPTGIEPGKLWRRLF